MHNDRRHSDAELARKLRHLERGLNHIATQLEHIMADLSVLTAGVARNNDVVQSAILLLQNIKTQLDAAGTDPVALKALSDQLGTQDDQLASAIVQNTPAA